YWKEEYLMHQTMVQYPAPERSVMEAGFLLECPGNFQWVKPAIQIRFPVWLLECPLNHFLRREYHVASHQPRPSQNLLTIKKASGVSWSEKIYRPGPSYFLR